MSPFTFVSFCTVMLFSHEIGAHPWGAPETACKTMFPIHKRPAQSSPCPFEAHPHTAEIFSNSSIQLTLQLNMNSLLGSSAESSSSSGSKESDIEDFKGYMIMAFDTADESVAIGSFVTNQDSHTINCHGGHKNAATHSTKSHKSSVKLLWTPPANFEGEVVFMTTFVSSKKYFWLKQVSSPVIVKLGEQPAPLTSEQAEHIEQQEPLFVTEHSLFKSNSLKVSQVEEYDVEIIETEQYATLQHYVDQLNNYLSLWVFCSGLVIVFSLAVIVKLVVRCRTEKYVTLESQS